MQDIFHLFRALPLEFRDVDHAVFAAKEFHDGADARDDARDLRSCRWYPRQASTMPLIRSFALIMASPLTEVAKEEAAVFDVDLDSEFAS